MPWSIESLGECLLVGSTLVEGSTLSEREASEVLRGRTVAGHPVSEVRELIQYRSAVQWLIQELARSPYLSVDLIQGVHARLFAGTRGAGRWKDHRNYTFLSSGSRLDYLAPARVDEAMQEWVDRANADTAHEAAVGAGDLYHTFQTIHPFEDGNGRIGRVLVAYWAHWKHGLDFTFRFSCKLEHLEALEAAANDDMAPLVTFFAERLTRDVAG